MGKLVPLASLSGHEERVWQVAWSPKGELLASCSADKTVRIWSRDGKLKQVLKDAHSRTVRSVCWSPDGRYLAASSFDSTVSIWRRNHEDEFQCTATLEGHENEVKSVKWDSTGELIATCGRDKSVWVWEVHEDHVARETEYEVLSVQHGHLQDVKFVSWHPKEKVLFSASYDNTIKLWAPEDDATADDWESVGTLQGHTSTVWCLAFDASGDNLVSVGDDKNVIFWQRDAKDSNAHQWRNACTLTGYHKRTIFFVDWCRNTGLVATACGDNHLRVFRPTKTDEDGASLSFSLAADTEAHDADLNCVAFCPGLRRGDNEGGSLLATVGDDCLVKLWRFEPDDDDVRMAE